ncbi:CPBP family intramembrane glutamic endopeptidase [Phocicoccus pinnipedialis]|uniref:CAAX amino terminal protease self-immunity n=1 Tax=Phocicoccus pinnipedialis TaxID=110845 RepID=A0A6V7RA17_9BACL|nr:type II CAAX endopeptidase family protein [Jeotgalicoccus pinnipedialis]MBP1940145.1 membrane protease YdiL (CAAX protease family) [Jeotgalicoccus pinnipedialis]CAD2073735.1 CAAX amino terminal protease self-immunity [Jeotgalicoccus pinnipedialis]
MRKAFSLFIILTFIIVQLAVIPVGVVLGFIYQDLTQAELIEKIMPYQFGAFVFGAIAVIILGNTHKDKNIFERSENKSPLYVTVLWIIGGTFLAYTSQIVAGLINVYLLGNPIESENTESIIDMVLGAPYMVILVVVLGPIIEEYVFRRAIFAELYEVLARINKGVAFLLAGLISGIIFALAHWDFTHILIYLAMSYTFSFVYLMTKRLIVPIMVHMIMNGIVVLLQVALKDQIDALEKLQSATQFIIQLF